LYCGIQGEALCRPSVDDTIGLKGYPYTGGLNWIHETSREIWAVLDVCVTEAVRREAGNDDAGSGGNVAGIGSNGQTIRRRRLVPGGVMIPADHVETLLVQALRHCRAHATETDKAGSMIFSWSMRCIPSLSAPNRPSCQ
jgi:hypothetical protein